MKKLAVCGGSWMTAISSHMPEHGTHFTELLADHLQLEYIALADLGQDNKTICLQIEHGLELGCDVFAIGIENPERVTLVSNAQLSNKKYMLQNIEYQNTQSRSWKRKQKLGKAGYYFSMPIINITSPQHQYINSDQKKYVKDYVKYQYSEKQMSRTDAWMLCYWLNKLQQKNIKLMLFCDKGNPIKDLDEMQQFRSYMMPSNTPYEGYNPDIKSESYHTTQEYQKEAFQKVLKFYFSA